MQIQFGHMLLKMGNVIMLEGSSSWLISIQAIQVVIIFLSHQQSHLIHQHLYYHKFSVTIKLDMDTGCCSIALNGGMFLPVFNHLPRQPYHAFVNFSDDRGDRIDVVRCVKRSQERKRISKTV